MSSLVTQTLDQNLKVLLISPTSQLSGLIADYFQDHHLEVLELKPEFFVDQNQTLAKLNQEKFYKIIFVYGLTEYETNLYHLIVRFLAKRSEKTLVISRYDTSLKKTAVTSQEIFQKWLEFTKQQERFLRFANEQLSNKQFYLAQDLLLEPTQLSYPFKFFIQAINQDKILDPSQELRLVTTPHFFQTIKAEFFKPQPRNVLVKGAPADSQMIASLIKRLYGLYFRAHLEVLSYETQKEQRPNFELIECVVASKIEPVIDQKVRLIPQLSSELKHQFKFGQLISTAEYKPRQAEAYRVEVATNNDELASKKKEFTQKQSGEVLEKASQTTTQRLQSQAESTNKYQNLSKTNNSNSFDAEINQIFTKQRVEHKVDKTLQKVEVFEKIAHQAKHKKIVFWGGFSLLLSGLIFLVLLGLFRVSYGRAKQSFVQSLQAFSSAQTQTQAKTQGQKPSQKSLTTLKTQAKIYSKVVDLAIFEDSLYLVDFYQKILQIDQSLTQAQTLSAQLLQSFLTNGGEALSEKLKKQTNLVKNAYTELSVAQAELDEINLAQFSPEQQKIITDFEKQLVAKRQQLAQVQQFQPLIPDLLGITGKKTYVLLLQDNLELRPTGGFIQALAVLTVDNGLLIDSQVFNTYELDKKVLADLTPPPEITSLLGEDRLYLRDSNWNPDFTLASQKISWFVKEALNKPVDGMLAVNYLVIRDLLKQTGDLSLPSYNETLTANNLFERLIYHAQEEKNLQDDNYPEAILKMLLVHLKEQDQAGLTQFMQVVQQQVEQKQVLLTMSNVEKNQVLTDLGWSGQVIHPNCPAQFSQQSCLVDPFYQVEANIGVNKVNANILREVDHTIKLNGNSVTHKRQIIYDNQARSEIWPLGTYKAYVRFYVNPLAKLKQITIDNQAVNPDLVVSYLEHERKVWGVLVEVPAQKSVAVELEYSYQHEQPTSFSYLFFDQKQPGVATYPLDISIQHSPALLPTLIAPQADVDGTSVNFVDQRTSHAFVGVQFER